MGIPIGCGGGSAIRLCFSAMPSVLPTESSIAQRIGPASGAATGTSQSRSLLIGAAIIGGVLASLFAGLGLVGTVLEVIVWLPSFWRRKALPIMWKPWREACAMVALPADAWRFR
jgi:hypothetical protein